MNPEVEPVFPDRELGLVDEAKIVRQLDSEAQYSSLPTPDAMELRRRTEQRTGDHNPMAALIEGENAIIRHAKDAAVRKVVLRHRREYDT